MKPRNRSDRLLRAGLVGTVVAALCCFTPILVVLFGVVGLAAVVGYLDVVLFPALGFFILLTVYALWRRRRRVAASIAAGTEGNPR